MSDDVKHRWDEMAEDVDSAVEKVGGEVDDFGDEPDVGPEDITEDLTEAARQAMERADKA